MDLILKRINKNILMEIYTRHISNLTADDLLLLLSMTWYIKGLILHKKFISLKVEFYFDFTLNSLRFFLICSN